MGHGRGRGRGASSGISAFRCASPCRLSLSQPNFSGGRRGSAAEGGLAEAGKSAKLRLPSQCKENPTESCGEKGTGNKEKKLSFSPLGKVWSPQTHLQGAKLLNRGTGVPAGR